MKNQRRRGMVLHCFSPPVMLATCIIETALLLYVLWRYKPVLTVRLIAALLFCLAAFQLVEYNICEELAGGIGGWSRLGFVAITLLPPLGFHLMQAISGRGWSGLKWLAYGGAISWTTIFTFAGQIFETNVCGGNYVIFHLSGNLGGLYIAYYFFWLLATILLAAYFARTTTKRIRSALYMLILGYCVFLVPTMVVNTLQPQTAGGMPSIMCGFAILFAAILALVIAPRLKARRRRD